MSWISRKSEPDKNDRDLLRFSRGENEAFRIYKHEERRNDGVRVAGDPYTQSTLLKDENEWDSWLQKLEQLPAKPSCPGDGNDGSNSQSKEILSNINLVMGGRMSCLSRMPFSEHVFTELVSRLNMHRSVIRAINRNTSCTFSRIIYDESIVYNCRTAESWSDDMALTVTFFPSTLTTNAIWFGCNLEQRFIHGHKLSDSGIITAKLREFDGQVFHPMMLPTIFAEFERDRHIGLVRKSNTQFVQRMIDIESRNERFYGIQQLRGDVRHSMEKISPSSSRSSSFFNGMKGRVESFLSGKTVSTTSTFNTTARSETLQDEINSMDEEEEETCAMLWIKISHLKNGLENWKTQLRKMVEHTKELEDMDFGIRYDVQISPWFQKRDALKDCGKRLRERLQDLMDEYDDFIRECDHIMAGMSLATQLDLNHIGRKDAKLNENISKSSLAVAETAQRDGSLMKSIAVLGMIYLPATFVCTFFSMGFFQWRGQSESTTTVSPDLWIFGLAAVAFTLITVGVFLVCTMRRRDSVMSKLHLV
ncbi:hypothetical protein BBK36DRAFT_1121641 [Trichoderma citrinoviride]|uniref:Cora-domain-containing protein n=1 Tax=Trichoderma citrinoviride TaxID=58853 RepID=A0A2T4B783_9HYPO|nr:hypothetical protein BBK36DRAFT_1121641 [Trichoderma citrinoviride]PTB65185.1 hypothetical protein BBK36DRAFT_1121641 [Trichoderma citrinoviride]